MIGWEESGSVDGSDEGRWVTRLLEGMTQSENKLSVTNELIKTQINVKLSACLIKQHFINMYGRQE
jgi:hypothetical protein